MAQGFSLGTDFAPSIKKTPSFKLALIHIPKRGILVYNITYIMFFVFLHIVCCGRHSGLLVSVLDSGSRGPGLSPGRGIVLCSWARHFTLTVPLSTQEYKWVPAKCWGGLPAMH